MTTSMEDQDYITKRLLNLTLKILYLLTGKDYEIVKKTSNEKLTFSSHVHVTPPLHALTPETYNKKILEITQKIINLLTGEVPIRCQDVSVYFSMEEWEYLEGHKDLYKDIVMMEDQPPLTSPDGSSNRYPPERCPRPLDSQKSTQESHTIPYHDQDKGLIDMKVKIKEEEEDTYFMDDQQPMEEAEIICVIKDESSLDTDDNDMQNTSEDLFASGEHFQHFLPHATQQETETSNVHHMNLSMLMKPSDNSLTTLPGVCKPFCHVGRSADLSYSEESFDKSVAVDINQFAGSECENCLVWNSSLTIHQKHDHTWSCSEDGKKLALKQNLGEKNILDLECHRCSTEEGSLNTHGKLLTGKKRFTCPDCGTRFLRMKNLFSSRLNNAQNHHPNNGNDLTGGDA